MSQLTQIFRHPIKSLGLEEIESASLQEGRALPFDRHWALLTARAKVTRQSDGTASAWGSKINFVIGRSAPQLMGVTSQLNEITGEITLHHALRESLTFAPETECARLLAWLGDFWPVEQPAPTALVRGDGFALMDDKEPVLSLQNWASHRALEAHLGRSLSPRRWRANLWVEGWAPFQERELIGCRLRIGTAELTIRDATGRCRATDTNPETGTPDLDMLAELKRLFGHTEFGVFAHVTRSGQIRRGDKVEII